jgi:hypothetical protein
MKKKTHVLPAVVECDLHTGESRVLEYVELTDDKYKKQVIEPLAKIFYEAMKRDIESGKFKPGEIQKD